MTALPIQPSQITHFQSDRTEKANPRTQTQDYSNRPSLLSRVGKIGKLIGSSVVGAGFALSVGIPFSLICSIVVTPALIISKMRNKCRSYVDKQVSEQFAKRPMVFYRLRKENLPIPVRLGLREATPDEKTWASDMASAQQHAVVAKEENTARMWATVRGNLWYGLKGASLALPAFFIMAAQINCMSSIKVFKTVNKLL